MTHNNNTFLQIPNLACLSCNNDSVPLIVLPGSIYQINLKTSVYEQLSQYYQNRNKYNSSVYIPIDRRFPEGESKEIKQYVCLVPEQNSDIGCLCSIIECKRGTTTVLVTLNALNRVVLKEPMINVGEHVYFSMVELYDELSFLREMTIEQVKLLFLDTFKSIEVLETEINQFNARYRNILKKNSNDHFLLLSPLSNTLFFQLNRISFRKNWNKIKTQCKEYTDRTVSHNVIDSQLASQVLLLIDSVVSILPSFTKYKIGFLHSLTIQDRITQFNIIVQDFTQVFHQLYNSTSYIKEFYSTATVLEKTNLIATQLRSLKLYIQDVKQTSGAAKRLLKPVDNTNNSQNFIENGNDNEDDDDNDTDDFTPIKRFMKNLTGSGMSKDGQNMLKKDFSKLKKMASSQQSAEYQQLRNYFDIIIDIPFNKFSNNTEIINIVKCRKALNDDHYGLTAVKRRLIEYLSVLKLNQTLAQTPSHPKVGRPPILLLIGPPGVGKTSIAKSIANVLHRDYQRISLGGVYNEADLRGHRRTYVGAMCGSIINALRKSGTMNPLILLDEVDKISSMNGQKTAKSNGDPEGALLEILDFEQNFSFMDHYVGFPVDISQVLFFCTANDITNVSKPLLDRLEIINISGYTMDEKIQIGAKFLLPKQIKLNGFDKCNGNFTLNEDAWGLLIGGYTREAGVRNLERKLASIVRGKIVEYIETDRPQLNGHMIVKQKQLYKYLGFPLHPIMQEILSETQHEDKVGIINGLSYNSDGTGSVLLFEIVRTGEIRGEAQGPIIKSTGNLGTTLQESIEIGLSLVKSILNKKILQGIHKSDIERFFSSEYHLHVPMGGVSKDGPSAGMAITLALLSLAINKPIKRDICMTGEISLRGKVLPIGGLREKLLGAKMYGMAHVLVPRGNKKDVITSVTDDLQKFIDERSMHCDNDEIKLVRENMGLKLTYVNDIYDAIHQVWPQVVPEKDDYAHQAIALTSKL